MDGCFVYTMLAIQTSFGSLSYPNSFFMCSESKYSFRYVLVYQALFFQNIRAHVGLVEQVEN